MGARFGGWATDFLLSGAELVFELTNVGAAQVPLTFSVYAKMNPVAAFWGAANPPPLIGEMSLLSDVLIASATLDTDDTGAQTVTLTPSLLALNTARYVGGATFTGFALSIHARTADGSALVVGGATNSPTMSLTLDTRTFTGIQVPLGVLSASVPDHCPICGDITLRENWTWCAFHKRLECPNCADPEDRPVLITSGRWQPVGGFGSFGAVGSEADVAITVLDTDTIDLTLASNVLSAAILAGAITNTHIAAAAEIARSKLATSSNGNRLVVNDDDGVMTDAPAITPNRALASGDDGIPVPSAVTDTELTYLSGVTSALQTQIDSKITAGTGAIVNADINAAAAVALSKLAALTASRAAVTDGSGVLTTSAVTATELGHLAGVTSALQTQLNAKQGTLTVNDGTTVNFTFAGDALTAEVQAVANAHVAAAAAIAVNKLAALTASRAAVTDGSGFLAASAATATEVGYLSGVTSAIQTQINALTAGGGLVLLNSYAPSGAASVDITSEISSTYEHYLIVASLSASNDDVELWLRTDENNGASFEAGVNDYAWSEVVHNDAGVSDPDGDPSDSEIRLVGQDAVNGGMGNAAGEGAFGAFFLFRGNATHYPKVIGLWEQRAAIGVSRIQMSGGERLSAAVINAVQILPEAGSITGQISIFGVSQ